MKNLRRWKNFDLTKRTISLAADARLSNTSYTDDQVWEVWAGRHNETALIFRTPYGKRADSVTIIPLFHHNEQTYHEANAYAEQPTLVQFAPNYANIEAKPIANVDMIAEYWVMASNAAGAQYTFHNTSDKPVDFRIELFVAVATHSHTWKPKLASVGEQMVLSFGQVGNLNPVVCLDGADQLQSTASRIGINIKLAPKAKQTIRWVHAGLPTLEESATVASDWLRQDWKKALKIIEQGAERIPTVETGDEAWDLELAFAVHNKLQSIFRASESFKNAFIVHPRTPETGYSAKGDGSDYPTSWFAQDIFVLYPHIAFYASVHPTLAQSLLMNFLDIQRADGYIDLRPNAGNEPSGYLCSPLLANLARKVYEANGDKAYVTLHFGQLMQFFEYWMQQDADHDGVPEWQHERQMGYLFSQTSALWEIGVWLSYVESPDLILYLLAELDALLELDFEQIHHAKLKAYQEQLIHAKEQLTRGNQLTCRDRDTHNQGEIVHLIDRGNPDAVHDLNMAFEQPLRLVVQIVGGMRNAPTVKVTIEGTDHLGEAVIETIDKEAFLWGTNSGTSVTQTVFTFVERIRVLGLSRVYSFNVSTVDLSGLAIHKTNTIDDLIRAMSYDNRLQSTATDTLSLFGILIGSKNRVIIHDSDFPFAKPVTIKQHGVTVKRSKSAIKIKFGNGKVVELPPPNEPQIIENPEPQDDTLLGQIETTVQTQQSKTTPKRVKIDVTIEE